MHIFPTCIIEQTWNKNSPLVIIRIFPKYLLSLYNIFINIKHNVAISIGREPKNTIYDNSPIKGSKTKSKRFPLRDDVTLKLCCTSFGSFSLKRMSYLMKKWKRVWIANVSRRNVGTYLSSDIMTKGMRIDLQGLCLQPRLLIKMEKCAGEKKETRKIPTIELLMLTSSGQRQKGLTSYCFKYIERALCFRTDDM